MKQLLSIAIFTPSTIMGYVWVLMAIIVASSVTVYKNR